MLGLFLPALLGIALFSVVFSDDDTQQEDFDETEPEEAPTADLPDPEDGLEEPAPEVFATPDLADLPYNPVAPTNEPTSEGIEGAITPNGQYFLTEGSNGDDTISSVDDINNRIRGREGDDLLFGGDGDDLVSGQNGDDTLVTGAGDDYVDLGEGDDLVYLGDGNDGNGGYGGGSFGNDTTYGGAGDDILRDRIGTDLMFGEDGNDVISGRDGIAMDEAGDTLVGGSGQDTITGDPGDLIFGGDDADLIIASDNRVSSSDEAVNAIVRDDPTIVADFNIEEDALVIQYNEDLYEDAVPVIGYAYDSDNDGIMVTLNGFNQAFLHGTSESDIDALSAATLVEPV